MFPARLLRTDVNKADEPTIEIAHEALLRQWLILKEWLAEEADTLRVVQGVERAADEWDRGDRAKIWLVHGGRRLREARQSADRKDLKARFSQKMKDYLAACARHERGRWTTTIAATIAVFTVAGAGVWRQSDLARLAFYILPAAIKSAQPVTESGAAFRDCWGLFAACPEMVVLPPGEFIMGEGEDAHDVRIEHLFAVSRYEVTFAEWQACVDLGGCGDYAPADEGWGRNDRPVINVSWEDAQAYVAWLSDATGAEYRLLSEAEWEYAARAGSQTTYSWGDEAPECEKGAKRAAVFGGCDERGTQPVGFSAPNEFGLHDMHGNVWEWVADPWHDTYEGAPADGSVWTADGDTSRRVFRGGSWYYGPGRLRAAGRGGNYPADRSNSFGSFGFRVARTVLPE